MSLLDNIKNDLKQITGNQNEFGVELTFTAPDTSTASVFGIHAKHHTGFDAEGFPVNSKIASIAIYEETLSDFDYPVRISGEVNLRGHRVAAMDSTGIVNHYVVREWFPDEMVGLIVCILGDYE